MKACVIGSGAMGSIFGGKLSKCGYDVILYDVWKDHIDTVNNKGLRLIEQGIEEEIRIKATSDLNTIGLCGLIIVFVKGYQTYDAISAAKGLIDKNTYVITMQNGLGNADIISSVIGKEKTIVGVTSQGGYLTKPGVVVHAGFGDTYIAYLDKKSDEYLVNIANMFTLSGINTYANDNVDSLVWSKLMINVAYNALTCITRLQNGKFVSVKEGEELINSVVGEAVNVAKAKGIKLIYENPIEECINIGKTKIAENNSSMFMDVLKRKKTEIDTINGAIVREGKCLGISTVANETVTKLVKVIESSYPYMIWEI